MNLPTHLGWPHTLTNDKSASVHLTIRIFTVQHLSIDYHSKIAHPVLEFRILTAKSVCLSILQILTENLQVLSQYFSDFHSKILLFCLSTLHIRSAKFSYPILAFKNLIANFAYPVAALLRLAQQTVNILTENFELPV